jgi:hypothetical protein
MMFLYHERFGANAYPMALKQLSLIVQRESLTLTYNDVFLVLAISYFVAVPLTFLLRKPQPQKGPSEAH